MNKILTVAAVLGTLTSAANAAITSPLYLPKKGEILTEAKIGYSTKDIDDKDLDKSYTFDEYINFTGDAKLGITNKLIFNTGFNYGISRKVFDVDRSANFSSYYAGLTYRFLDDANKLDVSLNIGNQDDAYSIASVPFADLSVKYGYEVAPIYNVALTLGGTYFHESSVDDVKAVDSAFDFYAKLENEFIVNDQLTFGLDLSYRMIAERKNDLLEGDSSNEFKVGVDANYAVTPNNFVGVYFNYTMNDEWQGDFGGDVDGFAGGLKLTSKF